jgi:hypothetical protein
MTPNLGVGVLGLHQLEGSSVEHSVLGEYCDDSVVDVRSQGAVAGSQGLSETTRSRTDFDATDEHVVASHTDQPRLSMCRRAGEGVETVVELP